MKFLVRRVNAIVRQSERNQCRRHAEELVKGSDRWIGTARPHKDRCCSEAFVAGRGGGSYQRMTAIDNHGFGSNMQRSRRVQGERRKSRDVVADELLDLYGVLIRHK